MTVVRTSKWREASSPARGCAVRCELTASHGGGVENASAQARHQRARPSTGVNIQRGVSKGYENTSMNTGFASQPHCQLLLAPRRRNKPTLGKNTARRGTTCARAPAPGDTSEVSGKTSASTWNFYEPMEKQDQWRSAKAGREGASGNAADAQSRFYCVFISSTESPEWRVSNRWKLKSILLLPS